MTLASLPENYNERLDAVVNSRFEISDRTNAIERETLSFNNNRPKSSVRYNITWWTSDGVKRSDNNVLFHEAKGLSIVANMDDEMRIPGDNKWCILLNSQYEPEVNYGVFWTAAYLWRHDGTCGVKEWDEALNRLKDSA